MSDDVKVGGKDKGVPPDVKPSWKEMLVAASAVVGVAGAITLFTAAPGVTWSALLDAGMMEQCEIDLVSCPVLASREGIDLLKEGGKVPQKQTSRYIQVQLPLATCKLDSGTIRVLPDLPMNKVLGSEPMFKFFDFDACTHTKCAKAGCEEHAEFTVVDFPCMSGSLYPDAGPCLTKSGKQAGFATYTKDDVSGPGCVPRVCKAAPGVSVEQFTAFRLPRNPKGLVKDGGFTVELDGGMHRRARDAR